MPFLLLKTPGGRYVETEVGERVLIGRGSACALRLDDALASRQHAQVDRDGATCCLRDLGSRNGTLLNGEPVTSAALDFGDVIAIGYARILFVEQAPSALIGQRVAGCEVLEQIGSGGMGVVYRARQLSLDRQVALKVLHPRLVARPKFVERFLREARAAGALNHPHLVHVHDVGQWGDTYYYAMEFVDGHTAFEEIRRQGVLAPDRAIGIVLDVAAALACAHSQGICHRDVKPENIMLARDGAAKLADLGLATASQLDDPNRETGPDGKTRVWGSPSYMAPEVATGAAADPRADLYALGVTLFHMLAGRLPFVGASAIDILRQTVHEPVPNLRRLAPQPIPQALVAVVERLLAKQPSQRYPSADALTAHLTLVRRTLRHVVSEEDTHPIDLDDAGASPLRRLLDRWFGPKTPEEREK